jgi:hypothetical protein
VKKGSQKFRATSVFANKVLIVNTRLRGENSPDLVTLLFKNSTRRGRDKVNSRKGKKL